MWIVCLADISYEKSGFIFSDNNNNNKKNRMLSATILLSALTVKIWITPNRN